MTGASAEQEAPEAPRGRTPRLGCVTRILLAIAAAVAIVIVIGETFDQGKDADQPSRGFSAGVAEEYARSGVTYFETRHVFIVRLADGSFLALYDKSPKQQELGSGCRVRFDEQAQLLGIEQLPGFAGAFVEECEGQTARTTWRADGARAAGGGYGDLDRFETRLEDDGTLFVKTSTRTCTRSRGADGLAPFDVRTCKGAD